MEKGESLDAEGEEANWEDDSELDNVSFIAIIDTIKEVISKIKISYRKEPIKIDKYMQITIDYVNTPNYPRFFPIIHYDPVTDLPICAHKRVNKILTFFLNFTWCCIFNVFSTIFVNQQLKKYLIITLLFKSIIQCVVMIFVCYKWSYISIYIGSITKETPYQWYIVQSILILYCIFCGIGVFPHTNIGIITISLLTKYCDFSLCDVIAIISSIAFFYTAYYGFKSLETVDEMNDEGDYIDL